MRTPSNSWATPSLQANPGAQGAMQNGQMTLAMQTSLFPPCLWPSSNIVPPSTNNRFALPVLQMENSGRREGKRLAYCPALVTPGGLQTLSLTGGPTRDSLSLESAASPLVPLQRDSRGGGQGASSERRQSGHNPLPGWASCTSPPPANSSLRFPVSEQTHACVLGHCPSLLVAEARMGVEQGPNQGWDAGYHHLLGDLMMSPSWDQAPLQMGRLRREVRRLPQHELPPRGRGCAALRRRGSPGGRVRDLGV